MLQRVLPVPTTPTNSILGKINSDQVKKLFKKIMLLSDASKRIRDLYNAILRINNKNYIPIAIITASHPQYVGIVAWNPESKDLATLFPFRNTSHRLASKPPNFGAAELCARHEYKNPVWKVTLIRD